MSVAHAEMVGENKVGIASESSRLLFGLVPQRGQRCFQMYDH